MFNVIRKIKFLAALILLTTMLSAKPAQAGPLLDWLTGWSQGFGMQPTVAGYPPHYAAYPNYPSQVGTYAPVHPTQMAGYGNYPTQVAGYGNYPSQVAGYGNYPTQVAGYAPAAGLGWGAGVGHAQAPTVAYSPFQAGGPAAGGGLFSNWELRHHRRYHQPQVAAAACQPCAPQMAFAPVAACNPCTQQTFRQQVVNYVPQTYYRTVQRRIPVTNYRPVVTVDPCTGCPVTAMQPCVTYTIQTARVPVHVCRPIVSTVPAGPCSPCQPAFQAPAAATPYYPGPAAVPGMMATPGVVTTPGVTTVPAAPGAFIAPGQGLQPADIRPVLPQTFGPTPDTGVGSRVNRPLGDPYYSAPGVQTQPQLRTEAHYPGQAPAPSPQYQPAPQTSQYPSAPVPAQPQSVQDYTTQPQIQLQRSGASNDSAASPSVRLQRQESPATDANSTQYAPLRPIPKLEVEKTGAPGQPTFEAPDLLDPRDRTASRSSRQRSYSLIAWPEPQLNANADAPATAVVHTAASVAPVASGVELVGPDRSHSPVHAKPVADERWDDTGWRSARQ